MGRRTFGTLLIAAALILITTMPGGKTREAAGDAKQADGQNAPALLLGGPGSMASALVVTRGEPKGIVFREAGGGLMLTMLPKDAEISVGDAVVTAGLEEGAPPGIPIGRIGEVYRDEREPFLSARVFP